MSKQTQKNLFISSPFTSKQAGFYQHLLRGVLSYPQLGNRLIRLAEQACSCRQFDRVEEYGQLLVNIPLKSYQAIGCYFLGMMVNRTGNVNQGKAKRLFEMVVSNAPDAYKPKAILSLGALAFYKRDFETALDLYRETISAGKLNIASLVATRGIATIKSIEGYHQSAIADLENVMPMLKYAPGQTYFDLLNSYAVELGEVGRKDEARNIIQVVLASPFAHAYPEWQQTAADLQGGSRSIVPVDGSRNVLSMPPASERVIESPPTQSAKVFSLAEWKEKMVKEPNGKTDESDENLDAMDGKDLLLKLLQLTTKEDVDEDYLREIVKFAVERSTNKNKTDKK